MDKSHVYTRHNLRTCTSRNSHNAGSLGPDYLLTHPHKPSSNLHTTSGHNESMLGQELDIELVQVYLRFHS